MLREIGSWAGWGDSLNVVVTTPARAGKANKALKNLHTVYFNVDKNSIQVIVGHTSTRKLVQIDESDENIIQNTLHPPTKPKQ